MSNTSRLSRTRRMLRVEQLETRTLLSAAPFDVEHPADHHGDEGGAKVAAMEFSAAIEIVGTDIQFNEFLLPTQITGDITLAGTDNVIGEYSEALTPIFCPDESLGCTIGQLIGTTGVATFTFSIDAGPNTVDIGSFVTQNVSFIIGMSPTGVIQVASTGVVVEASKAFQNLTGSILSFSAVTFPSPVSGFSMQTTVALTASRPVMNLFSALGNVAEHNPSSLNVTDLDDGAPGHAGGGSDGSDLAGLEQHQTAPGLAMDHADDEALDGGLEEAIGQLAKARGRRG